MTLTLTERGYRGVLLHLAARRLRFVPPVLGFAAFVAYGAGARAQAVTLFLGALAIPIVLWGYLAWVSKSPNARSLYETTTYEFTDGGILYRSAQEQGRVDWDQVSRWREVAEHVLVYLTGSTYLLLPVGELDPALRAGLERILREKLGPAGRRARPMR